MRARLLIFALACLAATAYFGASAFNAATTSGRTFQASIVSDSLAYLSVEAYTGGAHACFVEEVGGEVRVHFASTGPACDGDGGGSGINEGQGTYYFHDVLMLTHKGIKPANLWLNISSTPSNSMKMASSSTPASMTTADYYYGSEGAFCLSPGNSRYIGLYADEGGQSSGSTVTSTIRVEARAVASC